MTTGTIGRDIPPRRFRADVRYVLIAPRRSPYLLVKIALEWLSAVVLLLLASPVFVFVAVLVKATSPGPVLYGQTRLGLGGRQYRILKFRTMRHNAEVQTGPIWAAKSDARITPVGRFLRDTHLDELPQLWNVLCGDMALIGPRPERPEIANRIVKRIPDFHHRLQIRPGITGLAQMLLRANDPRDSGCQFIRRKLAHDLAYVQGVCFLLDLRIILSTACHLVALSLEAARRGILRRWASEWVLEDETLERTNESDEPFDLRIA